MYLGPGHMPGPTLAIGGKAVEFAVAKFGSQAARLGPTAAAAAEPLLADSDLTNPAELSGKVAVVRRSPTDRIPFSGRAFRAQQAGAVAVIIVPDDGGAASYRGAVDSDPAVDRERCAAVTIPCICVGQADGERLLLGGSSGGVTVEFSYDAAVTKPCSCHGCRKNSGWCTEAPGGPGPLPGRPVDRSTAYWTRKTAGTESPDSEDEVWDDPPQLRGLRSPVLAPPCSACAN